MRSLTFIIFLFGLIGKFSVSMAQESQTLSEIDTIKIKYIYPKKNPLRTLSYPFYIRKKSLLQSLINAKVNYWIKQSLFGVNVNQAAFSDNWSGGGVNSIAVGGQFVYKAEYNKERVNFTSEVNLVYGKLKNKDQLERKTNDRIFLDNKAAMQISTHWYFFGSVSFESQFDIGYAYNKDAQGNETRSIISNFMSPGYITESVGFEYKPQPYFSIRLGTGTARQTFMLDTTLYKNNDKNFGVPIGKTFRNELAFQAVANFDKDIAKNLNLKSRYLLFAAYEKIKHIDQRLDITLTAKVNSLMNVSINAVALYDDDFSSALQTSQALSLGIVYKLPR